VIAESPQKERVVFKHNQYGGRGRLSPEGAAERDRHEVVGNAILERFGLPAVPTEEAYLEDAQGQLTRGIAAPLYEGLKTLEQVDVEAIKEPDVAVEQCILKGWMGDVDSTTNNSNVWILADGTPLAAADFGYAFHQGVENLCGVPQANITVMKAFARPENVEPILAKIRNLSDADITCMVDEIGKARISDWSHEISRSYSEVLLANRDRLRASNPYEDFYPVENPTLGQQLRRAAISLTALLAQPIALGAVVMQAFHHTSAGRDFQKK
jgi:hypothetical protein